jgi:DNA-binding XRE family transcriptional regulator
LTSVLSCGIFLLPHYSTETAVSKRKKEYRFDGKFLHDLRKRNDLTLDDLAAKVGTTKRYIWDLENGKSEPSFSLAFRLAHQLGIKLFGVPA